MTGGVVKVRAGGRAHALSRLQQQTAAMPNPCADCVAPARAQTGAWDPPEDELLYYWQVRGLDGRRGLGNSSCLRVRSDAPVVACTAARAAVCAGAVVQQPGPGPWCHAAVVAGRSGRPGWRSRRAERAQRPAPYRVWAASVLASPRAGGCGPRQPDRPAFAGRCLLPSGLNTPTRWAGSAARPGRSAAAGTPHRGLTQSRRGASNPTRSIAAAAVGDRRAH
jgi:hypothetical protein